MDKFLALPLPQRLLVVGVILAVVGGASYYFLVSPLTDDIATQAKKYKGLMGDYAKLKEYDSDQFRNQMVRERAEADKRAAAYARMLPREEEIPNLITSIKADADSAGLVLSRFDPVKKREEGQGYRALMINLDVAGTYSQFLTFLQTLAAPTKRLINVKNLSLEITPAGPLMGSAGDVGLLRLLNEGRCPANEWERNFYELALKCSGAVQARRWTKLSDGGFIYSFNGPHSLFADTIRSLRALAVSHQLGHSLMGENDLKTSLYW